MIIFVTTVLPEMLDCKESVNADNIEAGLSPFNVEGVALEAGRLMLNRINELLNENADLVPEIIAKGTSQLGKEILNPDIWDIIENQSNESR